MNFLLLGFVTGFSLILAIGAQNIFVIEQGLKKNYTLSDIHYYLSKNNFKKVFKNKMFFRKTFEYIYINNALINE